MPPPRRSLLAFYQACNAEQVAFAAAFKGLAAKDVPQPLRRERVVIAGRIYLDAMGRQGAGPYGEERAIGELHSAVALLVDACRSGTVEEIAAAMWWVQRAYADHATAVRTSG